MNIWYMQFILGMHEKVIAMAMTFDGSKIKFQARSKVECRARRLGGVTRKR